MKNIKYIIVTSQRQENSKDRVMMQTFAPPGCREKIIELASKKFDVLGVFPDSERVLAFQLAIG
ncbi:hypothetical protein NBRC3280_3455 [Acetobacter pasteurianus NBRC 3280]|uniref:Uncharacterized protein n=1 Tax=Acetobacter pasteurianus NBRC 3278 TaxID=1226660 RepID=A0A401X9C1_ACEPA|nr:hypothetical protein [Acetobacter pasteurianus]GCD60885.1 hypothetical protein NBRC3277_3460 [Acetobacter pasteurianus NBRC 3277]GCD64481.1 hypothetical protein NBRC3278_3574 [Acetobacter pasteurianus NBRC 3278]GCD70820.1 hypothetical protein NBRC3280_3455 [Acetobacter pasteurianus NBRC 3280]